MSAPTPPLRGDALLTAVTAAMVELHERYHHRKPISAKTQLLGDDLLACVMGGVYTEVEKTMIELQRSTIVQETRNAFQQAMRDRFISDVQRLSGRHVLAFISNHSVGPDMEIELFFLTPEPAPAADTPSADDPPAGQVSS
ncbi:MAG: Na-translocating system protein MpsC family protein [Solirubrobacteraceae bacterium]|nr:Na-translocating system protein MpsC family protein [Solirubrobacteraceae bacterium]